MNPSNCRSATQKEQRRIDGVESAMAEKKAAPETAPKKKRCFMITPIGEAGSSIRQHADWVYNFVVAPVMAERGYEVSRADKMHEPFMITDSIFEALTKSEVCVADLTLLNANVFYELGIRHALQLPVVHIAQAGTILPFDNAGYRTIIFDRHCYDSMIQLKAELNAQIETAEKPDFPLSNPLTQYRGREKLATSTDSRDQALVDLQRQVAELSRQVQGSLHKPFPSQEPNAWVQKMLEFGIQDGRGIDSSSVLSGLSQDGVAQWTDTSSASAAAAAASAAAAPQSTADQAETHQRLMALESFAEQSGRRRARY